MAAPILLAGFVDRPGWAMASCTSQTIALLNHNFEPRGAESCVSWKPEMNYSTQKVLRDDDSPQVAVLGVRALFYEHHMCL